MFNLFKCRHKRTYEVTTKMDDGSFAVNTYCRKCEECVRVDIEPHKKIEEVEAKMPEPWIFNGKAYKWVMTPDAFGNGYSCGNQIDEEHPVTIEYRRLEKLRHQGMLLEKVPEKYITVEVDKKYLRAWEAK